MLPWRLDHRPPLAEPLYQVSRQTAPIGGQIRHRIHAQGQRAKPRYRPIRRMLKKCDKEAAK